MMKRLALALLLALVVALPASAHRRYVIYSTLATTATSSSASVGINGLAIPLLASQVVIGHCYLLTDSTVNTTGIRYGLTMPSGNLSLSSILLKWWPDAAVEQATFVQTFVDAPATFLLTALQAPTALNVSRVPGVAEMHFIIRNGINAGTVQPNIRPEVNSSNVYAEIGSWCEYSYQEGPLS